MGMMRSYSGVDELKLIKHINGLFLLKTVLPFFLTSFSQTLFFNGAEFKTKLHPLYTSMQLQQANFYSVNKQLNLFT